MSTLKLNVTEGKNTMTDLIESRRRSDIRHSIRLAARDTLDQLLVGLPPCKEPVRASEVIVNAAMALLAAEVGTEAASVYLGRLARRLREGEQIDH